MINHYINLVCWRAMHDLYDGARDKVWMDSVSIKLLVGMFRRDAEYRAGTSILGRIGPQVNSVPSWFFITARKLENVALEIQIVLPFLKEGEESDVPDAVRRAILSLDPGTSVGLGVSSPKQNRIAVALYELRPDLEYHCLGAALFALEADGAEAGRAASLSGSGFEWLRFLVATPRRTWTKIRTTLAEAFRVLLLPSSRQKFKLFVAMCEPASHESSR